jgi:hypothetical protein
MDGRKYLIEGKAFKLRKRIYQASEEVQMTRARLLRSRVKGNFQARF